MLPYLIVIAFAFMRIMRLWRKVSLSSGSRLKVYCTKLLLLDALLSQRVFLSIFTCCFKSMRVHIAPSVRCLQNYSNRIEYEGKLPYTWLTNVAICYTRARFIYLIEKHASIDLIETLCAWNMLSVRYSAFMVFPFILLCAIQLHIGIHLLSF